MADAALARPFRPRPQRLSSRRSREEAARERVRAQRQAEAEARSSSPPQLFSLASRPLPAAFLTPFPAPQERRSRLERRHELAARRRDELRGNPPSASAPPRHPPEDDLPPAALAFSRARAARKCQRAWRAFAARQGSLAALARAFAKCGIALPRARAEDFDPFSERLQANATLRAAQRLLRRVGARLDRLGRPRGPTEHLLARLRPAGPRASSAAALAASGADASERFPPRVLLCAYMIGSHAEVVLGGTRSAKQQARTLPPAHFTPRALNPLGPSGPSLEGLYVSLLTDTPPSVNLRRRSARPRRPSPRPSTPSSSASPPR